MMLAFATVDNEPGIVSHKDEAAYSRTASSFRFTAEPPEHLGRTFDLAARLSRFAMSETVDAAAPAYETRLDQNPRWALSEGSRHFEEKSAVFAALHKIADRLDALGISYAVAGGMALFRHGLRRFTEDVDILISPEDLRVVHEQLEGLGYLPAHPGSKNLRDTEWGVRIEFLTTGAFPGDGKEKPVAFPDPREASMVAEGIRYVTLPVLIELKLASGMTHPGRLKDLADVLELIKILNLPAEYSDQLDPYVRRKFQELWGQARAASEYED